MYTSHHVALSISNRDKSVNFYSLLDFEPFYDWSADDGSLTITHLQNKNSGFILELFCYKDFQNAPETIHATATDLPILGTKHFGLRVESIETARTDLSEKGVVDGNIEIKQGRTGLRFFFIEDPDGILVEISEDKRIRV